MITVSVDFDGTITKSSDPDSPDFNVIRPDCKQAMWNLYALGVRFYLLTGRRDEWTQEAIDLCKEWDLPIDTSNPHRKIITDFYIDDRDLSCSYIDWNEIYGRLCLVRRLRGDKV